MSDLPVAAYFKDLQRLCADAEVTDNGGMGLDLPNAMDGMIRLFRRAHDAGRQLIFVGNGGSAAIASQMAIDFMRNGALKAMALNDAAALTCAANDIGYDQVFAKQMEWSATAGDVLVVISSSGQSANILNAVTAARARGCHVITLSGFDPDNPLRRLGDLNLFVASRQYGFVELAHLTLCHAVLDLHCGWQAEGAPH